MRVDYFNTHKSLKDSFDGELVHCFNGLVLISGDRTISAIQAGVKSGHDAHIQDISTRNHHQRIPQKIDVHIKPFNLNRGKLGANKRMKSTQQNGDVSRLAALSEGVLERQALWDTAQLSPRLDAIPASLHTDIAYNLASLTVKNIDKSIIIISRRSFYNCRMATCQSHHQLRNCCLSLIVMVC